MRRSGPFSASENGKAILEFLLAYEHRSKDGLLPGELGAIKSNPAPEYWEKYRRQLMGEEADPELGYEYLRQLKARMRDHIDEYRPRAERALDKEMAINTVVRWMRDRAKEYGAETSVRALLPNDWPNGTEAERVRDRKSAGKPVKLPSGADPIERWVKVRWTVEGREIQVDKLVIKPPREVLREDDIEVNTEIEDWNGVSVDPETTWDEALDITHNREAEAHRRYQDLQILLGAASLRWSLLRDILRCWELAGTVPPHEDLLQFDPLQIELTENQREACEMFRNAFHSSAPVESMRDLKDAVGPEWRTYYERIRRALAAINRQGAWTDGDPVSFVQTVKNLYRADQME